MFSNLNKNEYLIDFIENAEPVGVMHPFWNMNMLGWVYNIINYHKDTKWYDIIIFIKVLIARRCTNYTVRYSALYIQLHCYSAWRGTPNKAIHPCGILKIKKREPSWNRNKRKKEYNNVG